VGESEGNRSAPGIRRHRRIPSPFGGGSLALWGREPGWSYRAWAEGTCTVRFASDPASEAPNLVVERRVHPSTLARLLERSRGTAAHHAARHLRVLCGGVVATDRADGAMSRWTRDDARSFAGPDGDALAERIRRAPALPLRNVPDADPMPELMVGPTSPSWTYGTIDPLLIGRRARTATGRWPSSDERIARLLARPEPIAGLAMLCALASLPEDWDPAAGADGAAFADLVEATAPLARLLGHFDFLAPGKGRWAEYRRALGEGIPLAAEVSDAVDMVRAMARQVVVPALHRAGLASDLAPTLPESPATAVAAAVLLGNKGLASILELSGEWHARRRLIEAEAEPTDAEGDETWPVPFGPQRSPDGTTLACLASMRQLRAEGDPETGMAHCVGGYVDDCATGRSVVLSVRGSGGARLSTVELVRRGEALSLAQHQGPANRPPPPEAVRALAWLRGRLDSGELVPDAEYLGHAWRQRLGSRPYDARSDAAFERAALAWSPLLPRPHRDPGALTLACLRACEDLVRHRKGPGERPILGPFGVLSETGLSLYPPPLRGDLVFAGRVASVDGARAALSIALRRVPPGLRDAAEPYLAVAAVGTSLVASGLLSSWLLWDAEGWRWLSVPLGLLAGPAAILAPVMLPPGEGRRSAFARRLRRARARIAAGGLRRPRLA
jgi:hypothetical protein